MGIKLYKVAKFILPRLLMSFLLVFAAYFFYIYQTQGDSRAIDSHTHDVVNLDQDLQKARERLKDLPQPRTITPAKAGARNYANQVNTSKGAFDATEPKIPNPIKNKGSNISIVKFNALVRDSDYRKTIIQCGFDLQADQAFLAHHAAIMLALANLLQYDPEADLSGSNTDNTAQHLTAAQSGLQTTVDRIKAAPGYQNDTTLGKVIASVTAVQAARDKAAGSIGAADFDSSKQAFTDAVHQSQQQIISNRNNFWVGQSKKLFSATDQSEKTLSFYLTQLQHMQAN